MSDKRSVATDALQTLGTIIEGGGRDAIHLAVEPVVAGERLHPGQHIGIVNGVATTKAPKLLGIVDPFLIGFVPEGDKFWLIVYPRQISSLRHVWSHPDFEDEHSIDPEVINRVIQKLKGSPSEEWIRKYASEIDVEYDELISHVKEYLVNGESWSEGGHFDGTHLPNEFWDHYQIVTNTIVPGDQRGSFFSCSC